MLERSEKGKRIRSMTHYLTRAAIVAALYATVTLVIYPFSLKWRINLPAQQIAPESSRAFSPVQTKPTLGKSFIIIPPVFFIEKL